MLKIKELYGVGKAKYVVNYFTGETHKDGSEFYDMAIFKNKEKKNRFIKSLKTQYQPKQYALPDYMKLPNEFYNL